MINPRIDAMLFNHETTTRTDFQSGDIRKSIKTEYKPKGTCYRIRPRPLKDIHTLTDWKQPNVPFNMYWKKDTVHRMNPWEAQIPYYEAENLDRQTAKETRPRLVITPAMKLDDMKEPHRQIIVDNMYTSCTAEQLQKSYKHVSKERNIKAPLPKQYLLKNTLALRKVTPPFVSPEWRMDSASWESRSIRTYSDSTREFWLKGSMRDTHAGSGTDVQPSAS